jgi:hypothetical protein
MRHDRHRHRRARRCICRNDWTIMCPACAPGDLAGYMHWRKRHNVVAAGLDAEAVLRWVEWVAAAPSDFAEVA